MAPWGDVSLTRSPSRTFNFLAVSTGSSTQASHEIWVMGSAASWSQDLFAPLPSYQRVEGYASRAAPSAPPRLGRDAATFRASGRSWTATGFTAFQAPPRLRDSSPK